jgi:exopolyphosphatase/guanosine-5'-triphosphate,3'-diphosphate pyrophosphatase
MAVATQIPAPKSAKPPDVNFGFWMARVLEECTRAAADFASDQVHDLRVALRRCRSIADGLKAVDPDPSWKQMKKAGKVLFSGLGELRDVHVMTEWVHRLGSPEDPETSALRNLLARRESEQKLRAAEALRGFDQHQWRKWIRALPRRAARVKRGSAVFRHLALERWNEAYRLHRLAMRDRSQVSFHRLRIGIKRFRYIVENFLPMQHAAWCNDLKELQDLLGEVHDLDVLWATAVAVNAFPNEESRARWRGIIQKERNQRVTAYRERMLGPASLWKKWRAELPQGEQIRVAAMQRLRLWASILDPDFEHSERVARLASQLFDGLRELGINSGDSPNLRAILWAAALMHDVGRARREKGHHKTSYRLIHKVTPPLGWTSEDMQMAAAVARFHRGALPRGRHRTLQTLPQPVRRSVVHLAGILRLANALDLCHKNGAQNLTVKADNGSIVIRAGAFEPLGPAAEDIAAARYLLEVVLRRPVLVKSGQRQRPARGNHARTAQSSTPNLPQIA